MVKPKLLDQVRYEYRAKQIVCIFIHRPLAMLFRATKNAEKEILSEFLRGEF